MFISPCRPEIRVLAEIGPKPLFQLSYGDPLVQLGLILDNDVIRTPVIGLDHELRGQLVKGDVQGILAAPQDWNQVLPSDPARHIIPHATLVRKHSPLRITVEEHAAVNLMVVGSNPT